jgi:hypothetical protein
VQRLPSAMLEGRQIARVTCNRCHHAVDIDPAVLKGLRGPRLYRALRCSRCGAREADVSIRWELGSSFATLGKH